MPPNHDVFNTMNKHQWVWCARMIQQDNVDKYEFLRSLLEYQISFMPDANEHVRRAIEERGGDGTISVSDEDFEKVLDNIFRNKADDVDIIKFNPEKK